MFQRSGRNKGKWMQIYHAISNRRDYTTEEEAEDCQVLDSMWRQIVFQEQEYLMQKTKKQGILLKNNNNQQDVMISEHNVEIFLLLVTT